MRYLLSAIQRIFIQPTKFDNFKDEKISDCKTVSARTYLQLPLLQRGAGNVYLLVLPSWKVNIAKKPHCCNGVVDTLGLFILGMSKVVICISWLQSPAQFLHYTVFFKSQDLSNSSTLCILIDHWPKRYLILYLSLTSKILGCPPHLKILTGSCLNDNFLNLTFCNLYANEIPTILVC